MFQESPETISIVFSHAIENSSKFNQVFGISNHTSHFIFKVEKLNWMYSTSTQLLYTFPRADISNKCRGRADLSFSHLSWPAGTALTGDITAEKGRQCPVLYHITAGTQLKLEEQEAWNRNALRGTRFVTQECSSTDKLWKNRQRKMDSPRWKGNLIGTIRGRHEKAVQRTMWTLLMILPSAAPLILIFLWDQWTTWNTLAGAITLP